MKWNVFLPSCGAPFCSRAPDRLYGRSNHDQTYYNVLCVCVCLLHTVLNLHLKPDWCITDLTAEWLLTVILNMRTFEWNANALHHVNILFTWSKNKPVVLRGATIFARKWDYIQPSDFNTAKCSNLKFKIWSSFLSCYMKSRYFQCSSCVDRSVWEWSVYCISLYNTQGRRRRRGNRSLPVIEFTPGAGCSTTL